MARLNRLDGFEDTRTPCDLQLKRVERQVDRARAETLTDTRAKARGINEAAPSGRLAPADESGECGAAGIEQGPSF